MQFINMFLVTFPLTFSLTSLKICFGQRFNTDDENECLNVEHSACMML